MESTKSRAKRAAIQSLPWFRRGRLSDWSYRETQTAARDAAARSYLGGGTLADRAFHLKLDQALQLHAVFHRKLADEIVHETVHAQAHRLRFGEAALLHVENL